MISNDHLLRELIITDRKYAQFRENEERIPKMIDIESTQYGDIIVLFKRPTEMRLGQRYWMEQAGIELHTLFTCQDYGHCEIHFVQSDVGMGIGVDADDVVFMWNKGYDPESYDLVYRIKLKSHRYNHVLRWAIDLAFSHPHYDKTYMYRSCWFCWFRKCIPLCISDSRRGMYTCASLTYSTLAVAGFTDLPWDGATNEKKEKRYKEMMRDRNPIVSDVQDLLQNTLEGIYVRSSDIVLVDMLEGVPAKLSLAPEMTS